MQNLFENIFYIASIKSLIIKYLTSMHCKNVTKAYICAIKTGKAILSDSPLRAQTTCTVLRSMAMFTHS